MKKLTLFYCSLFAVAITQQTEALTLFSPDFTSYGPLTQEMSCYGQSIIPTLIWQDVPKGTQSFALTVTDPDAPSGLWTHGIFYNIPADQTQLIAGQWPKLIQIGLNSWGKTDYGGPCPPDENPHRYIFTLYALNNVFNFKDAPDLPHFQDEIKSSTLTTAQLIGVYERPSQ